MKKFRVSGNSMYPILKNGDVFLARRRKKDEIPDAGAIVVAEYGEKLIVKQFFPAADEDSGEIKAFLLGFNRRASRDSRSFGALPLGAVRYIRTAGCGSFREMFEGLRRSILSALKKGRTV